MATSQASQVIERLRRVLLHEAGLGDAQLLGCFIEHRDEAAFAALVKRHGRLVWNVCRRLLGQQDAEDAFQATFLVLIQKAASIRRRELLASWLYGVAHQTALQARRTAARRRTREKQVMDMPEPAIAAQDWWNDLQPLLDQELSRLPEAFRVVLLLSDMEGQMRKEVARQLGLPEGTVASRLARARALLAKRLARHGLAASGATLALVLSEKASAASVPTSVVSATTRVGGLLAAGTATTGAVSVKVAALTEGVLKAMLLSKLKVATATLLVVLAVVGGAGLSYQTPAAVRPKVQAATEQANQEKPPAGKPLAEEKPFEPFGSSPLKGTWRVVSVTGGDGAFDVFKRMDLTFVGQRLIVMPTDPTDPGPASVYQVHLGAKRPTPEIDFYQKDHLAEARALGVYAVKGDELRLCFSNRTGTRSAGLEPSKHQALLVARRVDEDGRVPEEPRKVAPRSRPSPAANREASDKESRPIRRWQIVFDTRDGHEYAEQLEALGARLAIPTTEPSRYRLICDLTKRPVQAATEDISKRKEAFLVESDPKTIKLLLKELGLQDAPEHLVVLLPRFIEDELRRRELAFAHRPENDVVETIFRLSRTKGGFDFQVTSQR
jgi:RNA polymerase sigma factor (sigma-70 family)